MLSGSSHLYKPFFLPGNVDGSLGVRGAQAEQEAAGLENLVFKSTFSTTLGLAAPAGMTPGGFETAASRCQSACTTTALWHT